WCSWTTPGGTWPSGWSFPRTWCSTSCPLHPGAAAGRAALAVGPGGGREPHDRTDRPPPVDPPGPPVLPGRAPGGRAAGGRIPLGHPIGTVTIQHDPVLHIPRAWIMSSLVSALSFCSSSCPSSLVSEHTTRRAPRSPTFSVG